jgi:hypothetical protein
MRTRSDEFDLGAELEKLRPTPRTDFTAELDARVAAGFVKGDRDRLHRVSRFAHALRGISPRRLVLPAVALAFAAITISTVLIAVGQGGSGSAPRKIAAGSDKAPHSGDEHFRSPPAPTAGPSPDASHLSGGAASAGSGSTAGFEYSAAPPTSEAASGFSHRDVERAAELILRSAPGEVDANAQEVFAAVHAAHGIVLSSSIHGGIGQKRENAGGPSANFQLLVPTVRLSDTLASLSRIADVSARHESTLDITAPIVRTGDRLKDSEATIDGLLGQLASAESDGERAIVERQLRRERRNAAALRSHAEHLRQRGHFAHVSLRIESDRTAQSGSGSWGIDDAFDDAGHILSTAAGVAVIGLAAIGPLALIALLAWLGNRAWVRHRRERVLG